MADNRIYNFSAGPSMLPVPVLERAASEMLNYKGSGMSVMEMSHRSKVYDGVIKETEAALRRVLSIPDNYKVLFLQGGATMQFAAIPMNLMKTGKADYAVTGNFANNAYKEAKKFGDIHVAFTSKEGNFDRVPTQAELDIRPDADYFYICANNTIYGTEYQYDPETPANVPLVADMSSNILSKPVDVSKYGVIYAGAQKNMGPAGVTVVIVREDLLGGYPLEKYPVMLDWKTMAEKESMYNTPPTYGIYVLGLVLAWVEEQGGVSAMQKLAEKRSSMLYDYLDSQDFYQPVAEKASRSHMNVTFRTGDDELDAKFAKESAAAGMSNLKGHRSVGGMRASIYNAMPVEGVETLIAFMKKFAEENR
ncbi:3-phosphoserine/phosphohydroxythreonine transaminase [Agathobaculum sp.]|uniref:3-phosphoserine/phosphohydroxythreonine transaminase n=1 Tax=Agathobaculum sp. TaxID=2048138 RepID=UPI002A80ED59|nr:3-phosphoserine/phosphohydroxythreonine transaminase [Agathobaculum sp.]MDY3617703.1 3-phosphoserine/phosphohydroxythreonine transaminase [Agathobaculum sp.]